MNFLSPAFLWILPAAAVPILLHLINRRHPKKLEFSHIAWLKEIHQKVMPRKKLREILLLIVRVLLIAFLVLFFARPLMKKGNILTGPNERGTMIVLVDISASMSAVVGGRDVLSLAMEQIQELLRQWPADRPVGLIVYSDQVEKEFSPSTDRALILSTLGTLKAGYKSTNVFPAMKLAYQMIANQPKGAHSLLIVSDQARNGWEQALESAGRFQEFSPDVRVVLWEVAEKANNTGVIQANLQLGEEGTLMGRADVRSYGGLGSNDSWNLKLNGRLVGQGSLQDEVAFQAQLPEGGVYSGQLDIAPDSLGFDNTFYVAGRIPKGFRVLVVDGEGGFAPSNSESYYLRSALESPRDPRLHSLKLVRPEAIKQEDLSAYDVIVLANVPTLGDKDDDVLQWVQKGGGLFLTAGGLWPQAPQTPFRLFRSKAPHSVKETIQKPAALPALLSGLGGIETFEWEKAEVKKYIPLEAESSVEPLLFYSNGDPALVLKRLGLGNILCLTTSVDRAWTNLPAKPIFPPLIREIVAAMADPARQKTSLIFTTGESISIPISPKVNRATIRTPDGTIGGGAVRQGTLEWTGLDKPGLYAVQTNLESENFVFAVNVENPEREGDPTRLLSTDAKKIFPQAYVEWISQQNQATRGLLAALQGKDMTNIVLGAIFVLFAAESLLGWTWRRKAQLAAMVLFALIGMPAQAGSGNQFVYAQLKYDGAWDPYPAVHERVLQSIKSMTNIPFNAERKSLSLMDASLFESPFLLVKGNSALRFSKEEKSRLKSFIDRGGFVFFDDTLADSKGPFAESVRSLMAELFPDRRFQKLSIDHALYRSFFLLRNVAGRRISEKYMEGLDVGGEKEGEGRTAVVYCPNDVLGAWMKDNLGQYAYTCEPGGETQRWEAFKLTVNIIYFSLTGTYKRDAIHQPFIEMKLGS